MSSLSDSEIQEYGKMISILSNRMISNKEVAREAAQEVWIEVIQSLPSFKGKSKLSTWVYTIARRVIYKYAINERHHSVEFLHDFLDGNDRDLPSNIGDFEKDLWIKEECSATLF